MKVYMSKGYSMSASLVMKPLPAEVEKDPPQLPEAIREWNIRIPGKDNEEIIFSGSLNELQTLCFGIRAAWIEIAKQEGKE